MMSNASSNKVLVVAPHPDDETLGCGGTILRHLEGGDDVYWLIATTMEKGTYSDEKIAEREKEIKSVIEAYPFTGINRLEFSSTKLDEKPMRIITKQISDIFYSIKPNIVYLPNGNDVHSDHSVVFKAAYNCTKNFRYPFIKKILVYETVSETEMAPVDMQNYFKPTVYVDITKYFNKKIEIMNIFKNEVLEDPYPRSIRSLKSLAMYRGSRIGVNYAESFMQLLEII